ncbi:MAG: 50S ribosomal protein L11 methyltransferase [Desulfococcaceae bacterium]
MKLTSAQMDTLGKQITEMVQSRAEKFTPGELTVLLSRSFDLGKKTAAELIRLLVTSGHLAYADRHGRTVIDISFNRPVQVSPRLVLVPAAVPFTPEPGIIAVHLLHGASFGDGHHPTTRMSLQGIDHLLHENCLISGKRRVLDIGTGSGVLAIAALKLGMNMGIGLDIDPCAISEARENARINGLENRLEISGSPLENFPDHSFGLITANLRLPTLNQIYPQILRLADHNCALLLSGIHGDETAHLLNAYAVQGFFCSLQKEEKGWAALALFRKNEL